MGSLIEIFEQLRKAFERRKFKVLDLGQDPYYAFSAFNRKHKNIPIFILVEFDAEDRIKIKIHNSDALQIEKTEEMLQKFRGFFSVNSNKELERIIELNQKECACIEDIANNFTQAYGFIVS